MRAGQQITITTILHLETSFSSTLAAPLIHCHDIGGNSEPGDHREFDQWPEGKKQRRNASSDQLLAF